MGTYVPPVAQQNFISKGGPVVDAPWLNAVDAILQGKVPASGTYIPTFLSGEVQITGPNGYITSFGDFGFSLSSPGPAGTGPFLRVAGAGKTFGQIGTDAQTPGLAGINLFIAAGDAPTTGTPTAGGKLFLFGGGSIGAPAGDIQIQAGTSVHNSGGNLLLFAGNNTSNDGPAGGVFILAGTEGNAGGPVKIYATNLNNTPGDISFWLGQPDIPHSVPLWTMSHTGALFPGTQGAGNAADPFNSIPPSVLLSGGNLASPSWGLPGIGGEIILNVSGAISGPLATGIAYQTDGRFVYLTTGPAAVAGTPTGPNDVILSTLPVGLRPSGTRIVPCCALRNGGADGFIGVATIDANGGITISLVNPTGGGIASAANSWSLSGQKGLSPFWSLYYGL